MMATSLGATLPLLRLGDNALELGRPAGADLVARDDAALGVAVGVEGHRADDRIESARGHDRLEDCAAIVARDLLESGQRDLGRRLGVRRVERRLGAVM